MLLNRNADPSSLFPIQWYTRTGWSHKARCMSFGLTSPLLYIFIYVYITEIHEDWTWQCFCVCRLCYICHSPQAFYKLGMHEYFSDWITVASRADSVGEITSPVNSLYYVWCITCYQYSIIHLKIICVQMSLEIIFSCRTMIFASDSDIR